MECLGDTHSRWELNDGVDVIRHYTQLHNIDVVSSGDLEKNVFTKLFILLAPKHVVPVFGAPFKVVQVLAYAMATANKFHNIFAPGQGFMAPAARRARLSMSKNK